jgi:ABC-type uncharacterized transport system substrate-binding protein
MRRREFIWLLSGAAATWPVFGRAQQSEIPLVGYVRSTSAVGFADLKTALRKGLTEAGFVEGQNVAVEYHYADNRPERLSALIADLVHRRAAVIVGNAIAVFAAKAATTTVPIVFVTGIDPVQSGLVASLNRPGGNLTGVSFLITALGAKRLELLHRIVPRTAPIAVMVHRNSPQARDERNDLPHAAQMMGRQLLFLDVGSEHDVEMAFATAVQSGAGALFVGGGGFLNSQRERLIALAARNALPASYPLRAHAIAGGLMSYGPNLNDAYRQAGGYVARLLKGEKPSELPVARATKFHFVLNLKTAKALGLDIPPAILALADEVIE